MEDQDLIDSLARSVGTVLSDEFSVDEVLKFTNAGGDLYVDMKTQACELGWLGIAVSEAAGGSGMGIDALVAIYSELGNNLAPLPFIGQQLCIDALSFCRAEDDPRLAALALGERWGTFAPTTWFDQATIADNGTLEIAEIPVFDDGDSDFLLLFVRRASGEAAALLLDIASVERTSLSMHDHTRPIRSLALAGRKVDDAEVIASGAQAVSLQARITDHVELALAADCVGGCREALARTVEYLKTREQFGRPIGSFQALKHRAATMKLKMEAAASLLRTATASFGQGAKGSALASLAKARACSAHVAISGEAIQLHGGIGFTRECPVHLHLKRAKLNQMLGGGERAALDRAAQLLATEAS